MDNVHIWELSGMGIVRDGKCPVGTVRGWELSGVGIILLVGNVRDGNCPGWDLSGNQKKQPCISKDNDQLNELNEPNKISRTNEKSIAADVRYLTTGDKPDNNISYI